ncbi:MAG: anion transporter [Candidatus Promineifilaceae bacterium]
MSGNLWLTTILVILVLAGVAIGRYPRLRMNRATIALTGAVLLILTGAITMEQAYAALDLNTLTLLFAMMVINANLRLAGFFQLVSGRVVHLARSPRQLLAIIIGISGLLSALFLNDTIVLMFTPLVVEIALVLKRNPIPYLIGLATAANIGSVATITGNPQNMIIGIASGIPYVRFTGFLAPVALVGLIIAWLILVLLYRQEFSSGKFEHPEFKNGRPHRYLLWKSVLTTLFMLIGFVSGMPIPLAALAGASLLLISRRIKPERVFTEIDFTLLVFFSGLFIVTGAIETSGVSERLFAIAQPIAEEGIGALTAVSAILSNLISNVPAVLLFRPLIPEFHQPETAWLTLSMATTLAGNFTLLGSVANLIVAESARSRKVHLTFGEYLKAGIPITLFSLVWGVVWLIWMG